MQEWEKHSVETPVEELLVAEVQDRRDNFAALVVAHKLQHSIGIG